MIDWVGFPGNNFRNMLPARIFTLRTSFLTVIFKEPIKINFIARSYPVNFFPGYSQKYGSLRFIWKIFVRTKVPAKIFLLGTLFLTVIL
jgi:hypothetical protein